MIVLEKNKNKSGTNQTSYHCDKTGIQRDESSENADGSKDGHGNYELY